MTLLEVRNLDAFYGRIKALRNVSLDVGENECVGVIGPNGAGKTTLLECIIGMVDWRGQIKFNQVDLKGIPSYKIMQMGIRYAPERDKIFPYMSVRDNLLTAGSGLKKEELRERLNELFDLFPVLKGRQDQEANTLSGGEQQMLSLALALVQRPRLLLLDEPTFGLAPYLVESLSNVLEELKRQFSVLIVEQNVMFTLRHAAKVYVLEHGEISRQGTPKELEGEKYIAEAYFGIK